MNDWTEEYWPDGRLRALECKSHLGTIIVHRWMDEPGWFLTAHFLGVDKMPMNSLSMADAQLEAVAILIMLVNGYSMMLHHLDDATHKHASMR